MTAAAQPERKRAADTTPGVPPIASAPHGAAAQGVAGVTSDGSVSRVQGCTRARRPHCFEAATRGHHPRVQSHRAQTAGRLRRAGPTGIPIRYVRERPGELLHVDVKKLGRIPDGGGHRFRGRLTGTPRSHRGYDYLHVAIDDMSRVAYVASFNDERGTTCARVLLAAAAFFVRHGVRIERVMTDNAR